mgnify:CR=1 FL=1
MGNLIPLKLTLRTRVEVDAKNPCQTPTTVPFKQHINSSHEERRSFPPRYEENEVQESPTLEDENGLEENNHLGLTCSQESNNIHGAFEPQKGMVVTATCDTTSAMLQPNTLQVSNDNYQLHGLHDQSKLNPSSVYISESARSPLSLSHVVSTPLSLRTKRI